MIILLLLRETSDGIAIIVSGNRDPPWVTVCKYTQQVRLTPGQASSTASGIDEGHTTYFAIFVALLHREEERGAKQYARYSAKLEKSERE